MKSGVIQRGSTRGQENSSNYALALVLQGNRADQSERCHVPGRASARGQDRFRKVDNPWTISEKSLKRSEIAEIHPYL